MKIGILPCGFMALLLTLPADLGSAEEVTVDPLEIFESQDVLLRGEESALRIEITVTKD